MNPTGAMNHLTRAVSGNRPYPVVSAKSFTNRTNGSGLEQQIPVMQAYPVAQPVMMFPTYNYGSPYMYVTHNLVPVQPYYYAYPSVPVPSQQRRSFSTYNKKNQSSINYRQENVLQSRGLLDKRTYGTATKPHDTEDDVESMEGIEGSEFPFSDMTFDQLAEAIEAHFRKTPIGKVSFFNKLLILCKTPEEFKRALKILDIYLRYTIELTPETGTLLVKAACKAGVPDMALKLLNDVENIRVWPTLGGIHYLMINYALNKDTKSLFETFKVAKKRNLNPTTKTYHILIRECVDMGLMETAMEVLDQCFANGVSPNRTTYNILMNGLRKLGKSKEMLELRDKMDKHGVEINDTTVKFTTLAHIMENNPTGAIQEFLKFPSMETRMEELCNKFIEITKEDDTQKSVVLQLFDAIIEKGHPSLPSSVLSAVQSLKSPA